MNLWHDHFWHHSCNFTASTEPLVWFGGYATLQPGLLQNQSCWTFRWPVGLLKQRLQPKLAAMWAHTDQQWPSEHTDLYSTELMQHLSIVQWWCLWPDWPAQVWGEARCQWSPTYTTAQLCLSDQHGVYSLGYSCLSQTNLRQPGVTCEGTSFAYGHTVAKVSLWASSRTVHCSRNNSDCLGSRLLFRHVLHM